MKTTLLALLSIFLVFKLSAQTQPIDVADLTIKIGSMGSENLFYGFAEGDQIVFSFEELKGKELKDIEIIELPGHSKFMDFKNSHIEKKNISVNQKAIFQFKFNNGSVGGRICKVKIQRIPKNEELISFNTNWEWKTMYDTTYVPYTEDSLVGYDTLKSKETVKELTNTEVIEELLMDKFERVHSYWNSNSSRTYIQVDLPANKTEPYKEEKLIAWGYWIGVGDEAKEAYSKNVKAIGSLAKGVASVYTTPLGGIVIGAITELLIPTKGEDVKYAFISNYDNVKAFLANQEYYLFDQGKGVAAYRKMESPLQGSFYVGLYNDNETVGIDVNVKIVAIKEIKIYEDIVYDRYKVTPKYLELNKTKMVVKTEEIRVNAEKN